MAKKIRYTATFSDGEVITRTSHREYAAAWRAIATKPATEDAEARTHTLHGFSRTTQLAVRAAATESRFFTAAKGWTVTAEVAPAVAEGGAA